MCIGISLFYCFIVFHIMCCESTVFWSVLCSVCGPGSSVGIAPDYGLDSPGSNPGENEIFRLSRPALGSTQPRVKW